MKKFIKITEIKKPFPLQRLFSRGMTMQVNYVEESQYCFCVTGTGETPDIHLTEDVSLSEHTGLIFDKINDCFVFGKVTDE